MLIYHLNFYNQISTLSHSFKCIRFHRAIHINNSVFFHFWYATKIINKLTHRIIEREKISNFIVAFYNKIHIVCNLNNCNLIECSVLCAIVLLLFHHFIIIFIIEKPKKNKTTRNKSIWRVKEKNYEV